MEQSTVTKFIIAAVGTAATYLWGGLDAVLTALIVLACFDYISGWAAAWVGKRLSSEVGWWGLAKKIGMFAMIAVCNIVDVIIIEIGGMGEPIFRTMAVWGYMVNETLSIVENLSEVGVPMPDRLREALSVLRDRERGKRL